MKKLLLSLLMVSAGSLFVNAQRNIDWSTDALIGIDTIYSGTSGTPLPLTLVFKNNGPDTAFAGDSVLFQYVLSAGSQTLAVYPSATTLSVRIVSDTIAPGDTMQVVLNLTLNIKVNTSASVQSTVISHVINRPGLPFEVAPNLTNNTKARPTVWMNEQRWPVGLAEELNSAANSLNVYPNPSSSIVNFSMEYNKGAKVAVMDITGRLIASTAFELNQAQVDVSNYNKGIYLYQITNEAGEVIKAGKFTVN